MADAVNVTQPIKGGTLKISIGEGKDIHIELPLGTASLAPAVTAVTTDGISDKVADPKLLRSLTRNHYKITEVKRGPETKIE